MKGCPLRCMWCHSPESWKKEVEHYSDGTVVGREMMVNEIIAEVLKDKDFYEASGGGLTVSGGEPLYSFDDTLALMTQAKRQGLHTAIETSGYAPQVMVEKLASVVDLWLYDIKGLDEARHKLHTGVDLRAVLRNLRWLDAHGAHIVLRCPMIPKVNDDEVNLVRLAQMADELKNVERIDVEPYNPYGIDKAHKLGVKVYEAPPPPVEYAEQIVAKLSSLTKKPVQKG